MRSEEDVQHDEAHGIEELVRSYYGGGKASGSPVPHFLASSVGPAGLDDLRALSAH